MNSIDYSHNKLISWLLDGDISIQVQVKRDLLEISEEVLVDDALRIHTEGWSKQIIERRNPSTFLWGDGVYSPKWISTHYTLLELKFMGVDSSQTYFQESTQILLDTMWYNQGKVMKYRYQDMCVCAMILSICTYAHIQSPKINEIIDYILLHQYPDGGWNCSWQKKDMHSSLHTTISVLESLRDYENYGYTYRLNEIKDSITLGIEFMLKKKLFRSVRTNEIIDWKMTKLSFPDRWMYTTIRALDYLQSIQFPYDERLNEAIHDILKEKTLNSTFLLQNTRQNKIHFVMEKQNKESRWNTLRVLRILKWFDFKNFTLLVNEQND